MAERGPTGTGVATPPSNAVVLRDAVSVKHRLTPGRPRLLTAVGVPVLVAAALVWLVVVVLRAGGSPQPRLSAEFLSASGGSYLDVQLDDSVKSYGSFSAFLPGQGRVWAKAGVKAASAGAVDLSFSGRAYLDPNARADGTTSSHRLHLRRVPVRLVGQVRPADHSASVDIWVNGSLRRLVARAQSGGADPVVRRFLTALNDHDWPRVYALSDRYMRNGVPVGEFVIGTGAGAAHRITAVDAAGRTAYENSGAGVRFARVPIRVSYGAGTATTRVDATLVLAVDTGAWKVFAVE